MDLPEGFEHICGGRDEWLVRSDVRESLVPDLPSCWSGFPGFNATPITSGRGGTLVVDLNGVAVVVRVARRGGAPGRVLHDTYFSLGGEPRPFHELRVTESLRRRGVPTIEALAAGVRWLGWRRYRGVFVTRRLEGTQSLWELLRSPLDAGARAAALRASGHAIARLHAIGAAHPDLNLNNILVRGEQAWLIDFDRGAPNGSVAQQQRSLARLRRSARKLDPTGRIVSEFDLAALFSAVSEG